MPRIFINLEVGCPQVNLMSTSAQINQLNILYYYTVLPATPERGERVAVNLPGTSDAF